MGYYIDQNSKGEGIGSSFDAKCIALMDDGAVGTVSEAFVPNLVCVVDNGFFAAAAYCYSPEETPKQVKVTRCTANGKQFENLVPDSVHTIVTPPDGYKNDHTGVWVMGIGEPVKLLTSEFIRA